MALASLAVAVIGVPLMFLTWVEPHLQNDLKNNVKIEVADQLKQPIQQIGDLAGDVREIKGKLEVLDPLIRDTISQRLKASKSLPAKQLKNLIEVAHAQKIRIGDQDVRRVGDQTIDMAKSDPTAWDATLSLLSYKSFLNDASLNVLPQPHHNLVTHYSERRVPGTAIPTFQVAGTVPKDQAAQFILNGQDLNEGNTEGDQYVFVEGGGLALDGLKMKNVVLVGVYIVYRGGPLSMENVYFVNCTFNLERESNGPAFARAILDGTPSSTFKSS